MRISPARAARYTVKLRSRRRYYITQHGVRATHIFPFSMLTLHKTSDHTAQASESRPQPITFAKSFTDPPVTETVARNSEAPSTAAGHSSTQAVDSSLPSTPITPVDLNRLLARAAHSDTGSVHLIAQLLELHPSPTTATYHAALRALSVHPSPFLLQHILTQMRDHWITLTPTAHHDVSACLIRNGQLEEALEYIDSMIEAGEEPRGWLWDMLMHVLLLVDEVDEALRVLRLRVSRSTRTEMDVHVNAWYALFDTACERLHYDAIAFVWSRQVKINFERVKPSAGHCMAVMRAAARAGDVELVESAMKVLSGRGSVLGVSHYELLMDACLEAGQLDKAVRVLGAMAQAGHHVSRASTRGLLLSLLQDDKRVDKAWKSLERMREDAADDKGLPTAAVDTLIEGCVAYCSTAASEGDLEKATQWLAKAIQQYKQLHKLCPSGPTTHTFNILLAGCQALPNTKPTAMFMASEMVALKVVPNAVTYDTLILICLQADPSGVTDSENKQVDQYAYEDAFRYLREMENKSWVPKATTLRNMIEKCAAAKDGRAWGLVDKMREAEYDSSDVQTWLDETWPGGG